jgi:hypothetical protein
MLHSRLGSWLSYDHLKGVDAANVASVVDDSSGTDRRSLEQIGIVKARNLYRTGGINNFFFVTKQAVLMRRSIVLSLSLWYKGSLVNVTINNDYV